MTVLSSAVLTTFIAATPPSEGTYIFEHGPGALELDGTKFSISTGGEHGHSCALEGVWKGHTGKVTAPSVDLEACTLTFAATDEGVWVTATNGSACAGWCGARAWFEGQYLLVPPNCSSDNVLKVRRSFQQKVDQRKWAAAIKTLSPVVPRCEKFLDPTLATRLRSELALAVQHKQHRTECTQAQHDKRCDVASSD